MGYKNVQKSENEGLKVDPVLHLNTPFSRAYGTSFIEYCVLIPEVSVCKIQIAKIIEA